MFGFKKKNKYSTFATFEKEPRKIKVKEIKGRMKSIKKVNWKPVALSCFFVLLAGGAVYFFCFSPAFQIKEVKIQGNDFVEVQQIKSAVDGFLQTKKMKFLSQDRLPVLAASDLENILLDEFPVLESAAIKKILPATLAISVSERQTAIVWCRCKKPENIILPSPEPISTSTASSSPAIAVEVPKTIPESEKCFFADKNGIIFRDAPQISGTILPTVYQLTESEMSLKSRPISSSTVQFIVDAKKSLREINIESVGFLEDDKDESDIQVLTGESWWIYFGVDRGASGQITYLSALLDQEIKDNRAGLKYVDLRIPGRIYYK